MAEFAICFPVFLLLMLAVVDLSVNYGDQIENDHAARDAAEAGAVGRVDHDASCRVSPDGRMSATTRRLVCLAKERTNRRAEDVRVKVVSDDATIVVCVQSRADSVSGILSAVLDDEVHESRARLETDVPSGATAPAAGQEHPVAGHDWTFCAPTGATGADTA